MAETAEVDTAPEALIALPYASPVTHRMLYRGATLGTVTRRLARDPWLRGTKLGRLYAANTVGAVLGSILVGFVLIGELGIPLTVSVA